MKRSRIMAGIKGLVFLVVLTFQWTHVTGDTEVSCIFMESCMLPCNYGGSDVVIHWIQVSTGTLNVHSFYNNQDQLKLQSERFRGRTSLFNDRISTGNASLQLTKVEVRDEGKYKCYTSTIDGNKESFINLKIDAPVHKVNVYQAENRITCRSEGIYPKPELTLSTSPPSSLTFKNTTTVSQTEQQLYNISSSLILSGSDHDLNFSCTVSTRRNRKSVAFLKMPSQDLHEHENTIPCSRSNIQLLNLIWRFNHSQLILNGTVTNYTVSEKWKQHVKKLSESGSLTLQDISADQDGTYTCEVSDAEETTINHRPVTIHKVTSGAIVGVIVVAVITAVAAVAIILYEYKKVLNFSSLETEALKPLKQTPHKHTASVW